MSEYQPSRKASRVGQTKTVGNKSYRLNENHRWELIDNDTSKNLDVTPRAGSGYSNQHTPSDPDYLPVPVGSKVKLKTVRSGQSDIELKYLGSNAGRHLLEYPDGTKRYFNSGDVEKPAASAEPSKPAHKSNSHLAIVGGKEHEIGDFRQAAQKVSDNLKAGEHGYVKAPDGKLYEISRDKRQAVLVTKMRSPHQKAVEELESRVASARSPNEKEVLTKRLEELRKQEPAADSPAPKAEAKPEDDSS